VSPLVPGALFVVLGIPLVARKIPPNRLYGFRTASTLADASLWYRVNRAAGMDLVGGGLVLIAAGYVLPERSPVVAGLLVLIVVLLVAHGAYLVRSARPSPRRTST
jgi:uncharacterized membrane protein